MTIRLWGSSGERFVIAKEGVSSRSDWRRARNVAIALAPLLVLIALVAAIGTIEPGFVTFDSFNVVADESTLVLFLAIGQTAAILIGGIDLSVGSLVGLGSVLLALALPYGVLGLLAVLVVMTLAGALQGYIYVKAQIPSFIVTLGGLGLWSGVALTITRGNILQIRSGYDIVGWMADTPFGMSNAFLFALGFLLIVAAALRYLPVGRVIYAVGLLEPAALMSGLRVGAVKIGVFAFSGFCAGLASMGMVSRQMSGSPVLGDYLLLPSITAVLIGGTIITGGRGGVLHTLVGVMIVGVLNVGITVVGINSAYTEIVYGAVLILTMVISMDRSRAGSFSK